MNKKSPFENLVGDILFSIKTFFISHDKYLIIGFLLCFLPLPIGGLVAFIIACFGVVFLKRGQFETDEKNLIVLIFILSILNMFITFYILSTVFVSVTGVLQSIMDFVKDLFWYFFGTKNNYV